MTRKIIHTAIEFACGAAVVGVAYLASVFLLAVGFGLAARLMGYVTSLFGWGE